MILCSFHRSGLAVSLVLCLAVLLSIASKAEENHRPSTSETSQGARQERVSIATIRPPIIDGTDIRFTSLSTADGMSQRKVSLIAQDDQGFLWFATRFGLSRYDGYNFRIFVHEPGNPNSLSGATVYALFKDREGALWIGCDQFLNKLDPVRETVTRYQVPFVTEISQDREGILWLSTPAGLYRLEPATGRISRFLHDPNNPSSLMSDHVAHSGEDREGRFWVATNGCLDEFDRITGKVTRHISMPDAPFGFKFYEDRFGVFWIFHGSPNALSVFDRKTNTLTHYSFPDREPPGTAVTYVATMLEDRNDTLWVATHGTGLLKFDREHGRFIRYRNDPASPDSLPQNDVDALFADREGSIWVAFGDAGPVRFAENPLPFTRLIHNSNPNTKSPFVGAIYEDRQGILWVGTPEALNRIDRKAGSIISYPHGGPEIGTDVITICEDRSGGLWVGTYGHGLLRFDRRTGQFKTYRHNPSDPNSLSDDFVSRLLVDHNGTLWAASWDGLNQFDPVTEHFTTYRLNSPGVSLYLEMVEDRRGALWLGTDSSGLQRFNPATGQITVYQHDMNRPETLSDNRVNSVHFDRSGTIWVGTQNGLNRLDPKTGNFTAYTQREGLPGDAVGCVLEDEHGNLWMSTNNGVARFDPQRNSFKSYSIADGLPGPDLTGWGACFRSTTGEMFFGGFSGATAFFPDKVTDSTSAPPIVLTDFRLFGIGKAPGAGSPLTKTINYTNAITLSHKQSVFSIGFSALSYLNPATNRYRYMLEGLDQHWNEVGSDQRFASYTTLPAGIYTFRVQGASSSGAWTEPGAQLRIEILPPWWETVWFRAILGSLLTLTGLAAYKYRLHQIARTMSARFDERLNERTRLAREFHDTLLQTVQGSKLVADNALKKSYDPARMRTAMEELSNWLGQATQEGRAALNSLRTSTKETNNLAAALRRATEEYKMIRPIEACLTVVGDPKEMHPVVRDEVYRIGYEAIRNACTHSMCSRLNVALSYGHDLVLRVRDNGVGIEPSVAQEGKVGHFGLMGMRERAARIGSKLTIASSANSGTEIAVLVPGSIVFREASATPFTRLAAVLRRLGRTLNPH